MYSKNYILKLCAFLFLMPISFNTSFAQSPKKSIVIENRTGKSEVFYFLMMIPGNIPSSVISDYASLEHPCIFPTKPYDPQGNMQTCHMTIESNGQQQLSLDKFGDGALSFAVSGEDFHIPQGPCNTTLAEFTLNSGGFDHYDISLVNGQNFNMKITPMLPSSGHILNLNSSDLNTIKTTFGVFPPGCSQCADFGNDGVTRVGLAPNFSGDGVHTQNCPGYGMPDSRMPVGSCKAGTESRPIPNFCQTDGEPISSGYTITFLPLSTLNY